MRLTGKATNPREPQFITGMLTGSCGLCNGAKSSRAREAQVTRTRSVCRDSGFVQTLFEESDPRGLGGSEQTLIVSRPID